MKAILLAVLILIAGEVRADTTADLVGLGMDPNLAYLIANLSTTKTNASWISSANQAGDGTLYLLRGSATDDTELNADSGDLIEFLVAKTPVAALGAATPAAAFTPKAAANWYIYGNLDASTLSSSGAFTGAGIMIGTPVSGVTPSAGKMSVGGQADFAVKINSSSYIQSNGLLIGTPKAGITPSAGNVAIGGTLDVVGASTLGSVASDLALAAGKQLQMPIAVMTPATDMTPIAGGTMAGAINLVATAAPTRAAVFLPAATPNKGKTYYISNEGANPVEVYPSGTDQINKGGAGTPISIAAKKLERCIVTANDNSTCVLEN